MLRRLLQRNCEAGTDGLLMDIKTSEVQQKHEVFSAKNWSFDFLDILEDCGGGKSWLVRHSNA